MRLREFLKSNHLNMAQFGELIGTTGPTVCRIAAGQIPRRALMIKIFEATDGEVTPNDLVGIAIGEPSGTTVAVSKRSKDKENNS